MNDVTAQKPPPGRPLVRSLIVLALSVLLVRIPLLNYLGFEFSFVIALAVPWLAGVPAIRMFRSLLPDRRAVTLPDFYRIVRRSLAQGWAILLVPLAVATVNMLFVRNCSYGEGLLFFV